MSIKTIVRFHHTPVRQRSTKSLQQMPRKEREPTPTADRTANWRSRYRKQFEQLSKGNDTMTQPQHSLAYYAQRTQHPTPDSHSAMFTATLLVAREWEQPRMDNENVVHIQ